MTDAPSPPAGVALSSPLPPEPALAPARVIALNLALATLYVLFGLGSLQLILPPDYAAPVFPAAGLALAMVLRWGAALLPGVALGSAMVQLGLSIQRDHVALLAPAVIGLGAALQAWLGVELSRRWVGERPELTEPVELLKFFGAVAGLACLVSPSLAVPALWLTGVIDIEQIARHWLSWWTGDAIGVLLVTPIALSLFGQPRALWAPRRMGVAVPMLVACALLCAATYYVVQTEDSRRRHVFDVEAINALNQLQRALQQPLHALAANHSLLVAAPQLGRAGFERAHADRAGSQDSLYAIGWAERVPPARREAVVREARLDGYADFRLRDRQRPGDLAVDPADDLMVIRLIVPLARNRGALGVNSRANAQARLAQDLAIASGVPQATEAFPLSQDAGLQANGVVVFQAIYEGGAGPTVPPQPVRGLAFATLRPELLLREAMDDQPDWLDYCLLDTTADTGRRLLAGAPACEQLSTQPQQRRVVVFAGRRWELVAYAPTGLPRLAGATSLPFALAGLFGTGLLGLLLLIVTGRATAIARRVDLATHRLRESEARFRTIVEHAPVGVIFTDIYARPQEVNPAFQALLGWSADEIRQRSVMAFTHPDDRAEDSRLGLALLRGELDRYSRIKRYIGANGRQVTVRATVSMLRDAHGDPHRLVGIVEDIGEQLRLTELEAIHEAELAANKAKSEFLSRMSHELRTPLNAMLGFAQLLEVDHDPPLSPRQRGWAAQIQQSGWHLVAMINDTLDLSRLEVGQLRVTIADQALAPLVADSLAMVETQRQRRQIRLEVDLEPEAATVRGDATRLKQVLTNLLSNAIKYNHEGGEVRVQARRIRPDTVELSVSDTGAGMTPEQLAQLFQPFNRLGREMGGIEGTGIGLVITQRLLDLMGSQLQVDSRPGEGSTFRFLLHAGSDSKEAAQ